MCISVEWIGRVLNVLKKGFMRLGLVKTHLRDLA